MNIAVPPAPTFAKRYVVAVDTSPKRVAVFVCRDKRAVKYLREIGDGTPVARFASDSDPMFSVTQGFSGLFVPVFFDSVSPYIVDDFFLLGARTKNHIHAFAK